ncbi:SIS domain-containing protein [Micromonospora sp. DT81.3]|uniref:SIS domain-containing protein n=1 Tax=Micromonospora sp. DT81.3 TaxID=3416523 RepID=UPI003CF5BE56
MSEFRDISSTVVAELDEVFRRVPLDHIEAALDALESHQRIFVLGIGREGLGSKAFAMRLTHFGKTVHWGWDDTTPAVTSDDLFIMPTGPANIPHLHYIAQKVKETGATLLVATAVPDGETAQIADIVLTIPARTYGAEGDVVDTIQAMGSLFEQSLWIFWDVLYLMLVRRTGARFEDLVARHRNFE